MTSNNLRLFYNIIHIDTLETLYSFEYFEFAFMNRSRIRLCNLLTYSIIFRLVGTQKLRKIIGYYKNHRNLTILLK